MKAKVFQLMVFSFPPPRRVVLYLKKVYVRGGGGKLLPRLLPESCQIGTTPMGKQIESLYRSVDK